MIHKIQQFVHLTIHNIQEFFILVFFHQFSWKKIQKSYKPIIKWKWIGITLLNLSYLITPLFYLLLTHLMHVLYIAI